MNIIEKAINTAAKAHDGQYRKLTNIPYITHPFAVGMILKEAGCSDAVIAAGILHDVVEDTPLTLEVIEEQFGRNIASIVNGCSEPNKELGWEERKKHTIEFLKTASYDVKLVAAADKLHNLKSTLEEMNASEVDVWGRFKRGRQSQEWYYKNVYNSIIYGLSSSQRENIILKQLENVLEKTFSCNL
ncbi:HD domain-containing protein [Bacillus sp. Marseille-P3661]|uniref:HD domain-containing protein n=1 Tax=Bacillus sp. Marseille-P3661 TaxID=1936234 RepID=UPI000C814ADA|nr:HD domain-containing protein [Bacillus sp. Marseille-P3661]